MSGRRRLAAVVACAATLGGGVAAAGCGGGDSDDSTAAAATTSTTAETTDAAAGGGSAEATDKVEIADFKYDPDGVIVDAGTEITWTNSDDAAHTATADDSSFDTSDLDQGDSASVTFDEAGTFTYYCRFHPFMKATVEVQ